MMLTFPTFFHRVIERLQESIKNQDALIGELQKKCPEQPVTEQMAQLSVLIGQKDKELQALKNELDQERQKTEKENQACSLKQEELNRLQQTAKQLSEDLQSTKNSSQTLKHRLEEMDRENKALSAELEQRNGELGVERRNSLKRDKIIQGLSLLLKEKEKEVEELYGNLEEKEKILAKTREALHKAQLQKHQDYMNMVWDLEQDRAPSDITLTKLRERLREKEKALESFDTLLKEKDVELQQLVNTVKTVQRSSQESEASLQGALNEKDSIIQQLQHSLQLKTTDMESFDTLLKEKDVELQQLVNTVKTVQRSSQESEASLQGALNEKDSIIQQLQHSLQLKTTDVESFDTLLKEKDVELQQLVNTVKTVQRSSQESEASLQGALNEKDSIIQQLQHSLQLKTTDMEFAAVEKKEIEVRWLQLCVRVEREVERLNSVLLQNEETINSFDTLLKEKDVELQQLVNTVKTVQRSSQESEASLQGALNEKDSIIQQLQHSLQLKTTDVEKLLAQVQERGGPVAQLKVSEALPTQVLELRQTIEVLQEKLKKREAQISRRNSEVNSPPVSIKATVLLKKELAQKTQALNRALRRENQLKAASGTMLLVLEEAERLLELFWRVTLPSGDLTHTLQEEVLRSEVSRLQSWLSQQERMLTGAVKRLRSTNQLREGMEHIIIDQLSMTHGVLKKARENLEEITLDAQ
ncbi:uncharacterized protein LOC143475946 [Brachyhypopomus gauderio]|uniref:uncharacterized protein LOC143475946 n=1 Tax=Brachyhypopomus gauderio TaxID=698409 RepID=UPI0040411F39